MMTHNNCTGGRRYTWRLAMLFGLLVACTGVNAADNEASEEKSADTLETLTNYQINTPTMVSSGLPSPQQLALLKASGVERVIDLIPGDRSDEIAAAHQLGLRYHNVPVDWTNPTLSDFKNYVAYMSLENSNDGKVLTHCKLNWRGATFTYLYRITTLQEDEKKAKQDLLAIWQPNETWFAFMNTVIDDHNLTHHQHVTTSVTPKITPPE